MAAASLLAGCSVPHPPATRPVPVSAAPARLEAADRLLRQGCYACLQDALATYEALADDPAVPDARVRAVETATLLALREREMGLGSGTSLERARMLAGIRPLPYDVAAYLDMAATIPWKAGGVSKEQADALFDSYRVIGRAWPEWHAITAQDGTPDPVRAYLRLSLECEFRGLPGALDVARPWVPPSGSPLLLEFRAAICGGIDPDALDAVLRDEPRFTEAHLFLGEHAFGQGRLVKAERHMQQALAAFPRLALAASYLGGIYLAMEDLDESLRYYRQAVALEPALRESLLGELKCLSYLGRSDEAVLVADRMLDLGTWFLGDAYYWRAWNRQRLRNLDAAWNDLDQAKKYLPMDGQVAKLTGLVAFGRGDAARAEAEFRTAVQYDDKDGDASYYLGTVLSARRAWQEAAAAFAAAEPCYRNDEAGLRRRIQELDESDLPADRKARLIKAKEQQIAATLLQQARCAYNAAAACLNMNDAASARPFLDRAMAHPEFAAAAARLLDRIARDR